MELQVQELLEKIKAEGVDVAKEEANSILSDAREQAKGIVAAAESRAMEIEKAAEEKIDAREKASDLALTHASRDTLLSLRKKVQSFMQEAAKSDSDEVFNASFLGKVLPELLQAMVKDNAGDISVLVSKTTLSSLDGALAKRLASELKRGVEFKPFEGIDAGFRVGFNGSNVQYDFSADAVAALLSDRVDAHLAECLKLAAASIENE
ncbi:MAG: hypothetical protein LLF89_00275 [Spirochaetaceae bacterium]|nr:hypothetical protein [Spirochaetaceae bacterium]